MALSHDLRFGVRSLRRDWLVNVVAVISLALALAGNTTVFSLINGVLYRPLPYPDADRIVLLGERKAGAPQTLTASPANFLDWRRDNRAFGELGGFLPGSMAIGHEGRPVSVAGARVSPAFFDILGARVLQGRSFTAAEGEPGRDDVVMVTDRFLDTHMPDLDDPVGTEVFVNGRDRTIVGVLTADFEFFLPNLQVWLPLGLESGEASRDERGLFVVGRLRPGVSMEQARSDMQRVWDRLVVEYPENNSGYVIDVLNFRHEVPNDQARTLFGLLQGAVLFVLLIACVNIANLMWARGHRRQREIALRTVLGAGRGDILRQLMVESGLLAAVAGGVGLLAAWGAVQVIGARFAGAVAGPYIPAMDGTVVLFSLAMTVLAALLFGLVPARQVVRVDLAGTMKEGGPGMSGNVRRKLLSRGLVVLEIALSLVLLAGAGMMIQGFVGLREADPGFDDDNLLTVPVTLPVEAPRARLDLLDEMRREARALPDVVDATATTALPMNALATADAFTVSGRPIPEGEARPRAFWSAVDAGYLDAMGMSLVAGRFFDAGDRDDGVPVAVVNETLARNHFPEGGALGAGLHFRGSERQVVGIVGDTRQSIIGTDIADPAAEPAIFLPMAQVVPASLFLVTRTAGDPGRSAAPLRRNLEALHGRLVLGQMQTLDELVDQQWVGIDLMSQLLRSFGYLALLLAALGTYGVLAYNVAQRGHEIGIRMAVGARRRQIVALVVRQGVWLGALGILLGAPVVWALLRVLNYALQSLGSVDPTSALLVATALLATTVVASLIPALRAARMHPADVLRES